MSADDSERWMFPDGAKVKSVGMVFRQIEYSKSRSKSRKNHFELEVICPVDCPNVSDECRASGKLLPFPECIWDV